MSRISEVLKSKKELEKSQKTRRREELSKLRNVAVFKASMHDEMRRIDTLLNSSEVDGVIITVPDKLLPRFGEAIYSEEMVGYDIQQVDGKPNQFLIRYKMII